MLCAEFSFDIACLISTLNRILAVWWQFKMYQHFSVATLHVTKGGRSGFPKYIMAFTVCLLFGTFRATFKKMARFFDIAATHLNNFVFKKSHRKLLCQRTSCDIFSNILKSKSQKQRLRYISVKACVRCNKA